MRMLTSVIYQNDSGTITLLDLPSSIENGQSLRHDEPTHRSNRILSARPPEQPYPSVEPKGLKREKLFKIVPRDEQKYHQELQALIAESLSEIRSALGSRQWLLPRQIPIAPIEDNWQGSPESQASRISLEAPVILSPIYNMFSSVKDIADHVVSNPSNLCAIFDVDSQIYHIPPRSTFFLSDVRRSCFLTGALTKNFSSQSFDVIIMDPPWRNRSVRHAKAYKTSEGRTEEPFLYVLPILNSHLKADGVVGIWVTNKASIRQLVLNSLHQNGFRLHEEWIWIKITTNGEPVTPLDGLWRRPYEVLLLFHKVQGHAFGVADASEQENEVPRRIFGAVPNHHSQKPCMKEFIEQFFVDPTNYQALELFARNLTAGWFSWGDEVLKFNEEAHWASKISPELVKPQSDG